MQSYLNFVILPIVILMVSCSEPPSRQPVDVSQVVLEDIRIERFDREFGRLGADSLSENPVANAAALHRQWKTGYGNFYADFIEGMLRIGSAEDDPAIPDLLAGIAANPDFDHLRKSVDEVYPDLEQQEAQLTDAFKRIRYYLPEAVLPPHFIAFFSGFAVQIPIGEDYIGIGLDLFLGADSEFYPELIGTFPQYISGRFTPAHLTPRVIEAYIYDSLLEKPTQNASFLDHLIYHGKAFYLMDLALPYVTDSIKIGYTNKQLAWAKHFQTQIWDWMVSEELLYQTDFPHFNQHFSEAPFTVGLGEKNESAPKLGIYIGWQLIRQYMERHPETEVQDLLQMTDAQYILSESRYKGRFRSR
ncbi:MAG TPA: hypothetical protein VKZ78_06895 [Sphingobacteriaceae bacterium]|nr:hypothetical protein [Sphingobacteriaceae bacterium]